MDGEVEVEGGSRPVSQPRRLIAELGAQQHGVAARAQLLAGGVSATAIKRMLRDGHLHLLHRGVYAVGHLALTREGRWMAAVLAGGPDAVLSHHSAGMNWQLLSPFPSLPSITTPAKGRRRPGITHHTARLPADEVTAHDAIPTTTVARSLFDLASTVTTHRLEQAIAEAEFRRYADSTPLVALITRYPGHRGVGALKAVLATGHTTLGRTESPLEDRFLGFLDARGFARPELNPHLNLGAGGFIRPDCLWRAQRLIVELDGRDSHQRQRTFESDRRRDRRLAAAGFRPIRVTDAQLHDAPAELDADLRALGVPRR